MEINIEKDVPISRGRWYKYLIRMGKPYADGEPRDSFVFLAKDFGSVRREIVKVKNKFPGWKFKTMRISETERRIWRTK